MHAQAVIDDRLRVATHLASTHRMERSHAMAALECQQLGVRLNMGSGSVLFLDVRRHRLRGREFAQDSQGCDPDRTVQLGRKIVRLHRWRLVRVGRFDVHRSAAGGPQLAD